MKKIISVLLILAMALALAGCGADDKASAQKAKNDVIAAANAIHTRRAPECRAVSYDMDLALDAEKNLVSGYEDLVIRNDANVPLDRVGLRYYAEALAPESEIGAVRNQDAGKEYELNPGKDDSVVYVMMEEDPLPAGETRTLRIEFSTVIPELDDRFGYHEKENGKMFLLTFWAPQLAAYENGRWDESPYFDPGESTYNMMSDYTVKLTAPEDYVVAASGKQKTRQGVTTITAPNVREMAIVACNYMTVEKEKVDGVLFNMYRPAYEGFDKLYDVMRDNAKAALRLFRETIGEYLYSELDIVPAFLSAGGMEMPGLVIESLPEGGEGSVPTGFYYDAALTVAHEVAHQWFYCAVGNDQFSEPWLDESFATFCANYLYHETANSALRAANRAEKELNEQADMLYHPGEPNIYATSTDEVHYINLPCDYYSERGYGTYVYSEGAEFLDALRQQMGDSFSGMLSDWYAANASGVVHSSDFVRKVTEFDSSPEVIGILNTYLSDEYLR